MNIKINSNDIKKGDIFVALKGLTKDGHNYIDDAIENGADYIICEKGNYDKPYMIVDSTKDFLNEFLLKNFLPIFDDMKLVGITGTNGKTTSCFLLYQMLNKIGIKAAYIGTLGFYIEDKIKDLNNTTPDIITIYNLLLECRKNNVKYVVMEVSSHSLELDRLYGISFDYVVYTNLTQDHLDFHKDMEEYLHAKMKLFDKVKESGLSITNIDDKYSKYFKTNNNLTYGFNNSDFKIIKYKLYLDKIKYVFKYKNKTYKVKLNIPGKYNIYNSIISIIVLNNIGIPIKKAIKIFNNIKMPSGRMEIIKIKKSYAIIDYAHTPDAVLNVLKNVNEFKKGKVYTIIGCGGNRDKSKRKEMGYLSTKYSDYVIFTNDNPRDEEPKDIINDITNNLESKNYEIIEDRREAIKKGISFLNKEDILLILGKGHENYQIIKGVKYHFSDKEEVLKCK